MGFFKTIWMWIKRILFIVCMAVTALFATSVFTDDEAVRNALSIIMAIVVMLYSVFQVCGIQTVDNYSWTFGSTGFSFAAFFQLQFNRNFIRSVHKCSCTSYTVGKFWNNKT